MVELTEDLFEDDRETLGKVMGLLADAAVGLGEWLTDQGLGDPELRRALVLGHTSHGSLMAAMELLRQAQEAVPRLRS